MNKQKLLKIIGGITALVVLSLGVIMLMNGQGEDTELAEVGVPPSLVIDSSYNATLSGTPFYSVSEDDEDMFDDSLDTCNEIGNKSDRQSGWYSLVAYEDGLTVREIVFGQAEFEVGDSVVMVYFNPEDKTFEANPNRIIKSGDGSDLPLLDLDQTLDKGEVVVVNSNRSVDFCMDYEEGSDHSNVTVGSWNLVAKPDFEDFGYRSIWEVDFGKNGGDLTQYYDENDTTSFSPDSLSDDNLYWIYGGKLTTDNGSDTGTNNGDNQSDGAATLDLEKLYGTKSDGNGGVESTILYGGILENEAEVGEDINIACTNANISVTGVIDRIVNGDIGVSSNYSDVDSAQIGDDVTILVSGVTPEDFVDCFSSNSGTDTGTDNGTNTGNGTDGGTDTGTNTGGNTGEVVIFDPVLVNDWLDRFGGSNGGVIINDPIIVGEIEPIGGVDFSDFLVGNGLKLRNDSIDYNEDILLDAPRNLNRSNQTISLQFGGGRVDQREYVIFWEPNPQDARTIRIRARDNINDAWAGCSQIRVSVNGMTYQDGTNVPNDDFDVTVNDNGRCDDETDQAFKGKDKAQQFPDDINSFYGVAEKVYYDEVGRGFWAINNNGEIFENFSQNDGKWRRLPGLSTINRPISNGGQSDYVKDPEQFYVMESEENGRKYSLISWVGKDNRFYRYNYSGNNIIDGNVESVDKFGSKVEDTVMGTYRKTSTDTIEDVVYVAYDCSTTITDTVGFNADPKKFVSCNVQRMTNFGTRVGINGNDFILQGDRLFASVDNVWGINSFNGWVDRFNPSTNEYKQITTANNQNRSSVEELFFNNGNAYGVSKDKRLWAWNESAEVWKEVDYRYTDGTTKLSDVEVLGAGLVYADWGINQKTLFEVRCDSFAGTGDPTDPVKRVGCARPTEFGQAYKIHSGRAISPVYFQDKTVFTIAERTLYELGFDENDARKFKLNKVIESFNSGKIIQVIDAEDRVFVLFEIGENRYLLNPDFEI